MSNKGFEIIVYLEEDADIGDVKEKITKALIGIEGIDDFEYIN